MICLFWLITAPWISWNALSLVLHLKVTLANIRATNDLVPFLFLSLEEEIDGETLWLMNTVESIKAIFPKYKQQLLFLRERERLFDGSLASDSNKENEVVERLITCSPDRPSNEITLDSSILQDGPLSSPIRESSIDDTEKPGSAMLKSQEVTRDIAPKHCMLDEYPLPNLPQSLLHDIESGDLSKFNCHCKNRQILIDAVFYDLTNTYDLW